jgi:hypothetical protein
LTGWALTELQNMSSHIHQNEREVWEDLRNDRFANDDDDDDDDESSKTKD